MRFHRANNLLFCSDDDRDRDYVRIVAELVLSRYNGESLNWRPADSEQLWGVFFGGRAGVVAVRHDDRVCCVKLFYDERLRTKIRTALGLAKARRAYRNGLRLADAGVKSPRMIGYAERRPVGPAMIITELIEDGRRCDHWAQRHGTRREIIEALARYVCHMHDRGISHVDLSPRNILIRPGKSGGDFLLLDYEDARFAQTVPPRTRLMNLHHLHERVVSYVPVKDRLRFLRTYAGDDYAFYRDELREMIRRSRRAGLAHRG
jgi:tRNA A-37 threonylcarbamoyl transferase component Bud32